MAQLTDTLPTGIAPARWEGPTTLINELPTLGNGAVIYRPSPSGAGWQSARQGGLNPFDSVTTGDVFIFTVPQPVALPTGSFTATATQLASNAAQLQSATNQLITLTDDVAAANSRGDVLEQQLVAATANIALVQAQLTAANASVSSLQADKATLQQQVADLQAQLAGSSGGAAAVKYPATDTYFSTDTYPSA